MTLDTARTAQRPSSRSGRRIDTLAGKRKDELVEFHETPADDAAAARQARPWVVLVVDDDPDVHDATRLAIGRELLHGRPFELRSAYSAAEARNLLATRPDVDLILLDIIMETPDAGLELAGNLKQDARFARIRILVRTGQPGFWQDDVARRMPGIDGYISKAALTRAELLEAMTSLLPGTAA
jgi:CheY-like chemotaxis protein